MNLFFKSYKFYIFFFLLYGLKPPLSLGQDIVQFVAMQPEIINYEIPAAFNRAPNTSLCRNNKGVFFIGKENGILVADGDQYSFIPFPDPVFVSITAQNKVIYLTSDDFGFLEYSANSGTVKKSRLGEVNIHFPHFYPYGISQGISSSFLLTSEEVLVMTDSTVKQFFFERKECRLFHSDRNTYLQADQIGIFRWTGNDFEQLVDLEEAPLTMMTSILELENSLIMISEEGERFIFEEEKGVSRYTEDFPARDLRRLTYLFDNLYLDIGDQNHLTIVSIPDRQVSKIPGLQQRTQSDIHSVYVDSFQDTWIVYDFSICKLEHPSRAQTLDLASYLSGSILSTAILNDKLYIGTSDGIFRLESPGNDYRWNVSRVDPKLSGYINTLNAGKGHVFASGSKGLFWINNEKAVRLSDQNCTQLTALSHNSLLTCSAQGLVAYNLIGTQWESRMITSTVKNILSEVWYGNQVWILGDQGNILRMVSEGPDFEFLKNPPADSLKRLLLYNEKLLVLGENYVFEYIPGEDNFKVIEFSNITRKLLDSDIIFNGKDHLWSMFSEANGASTLWLLENGFIQTPFYEITADASFGQVMDLDATDGQLWITGTNKIVRLNFNETASEPKELLRLQSVEMLSPGEAEIRKEINKDDKLRYGNYRIEFNLADRRYQKPPYPYYRFKLTNIQEDWSEWSRNNTIEMENLRERKYNFMAQSVSTYGQLSKPVEFSFVITPPWYRTWYAYTVYLLTFLFIAFLLYKWRLLSLKKVEFRMEERIKERMKAVLSEKEKSDKLVADLFPKGTAEELKSQGRAKSRKFEMVTVLFSDIQGFTKIAEEMNPEILIDELDRFFFHFDSVVDKYNIEKIKTIGDAYMAAGGIPVKNSSNPVEVVLAGLEMQQYMNDLKKKKTDIWDLRIGIHTGPVISGVVGHKKLSYDIWGDTVNTASRMESSGEGGKVNISGITYSMVKDFFICEYRGKLPVKYKGNIDMYFVTGLRPELSVDLKGIPNRRFFTKLQMLKLKDIEERVFELVNSNKSLNLHFHKNEFIEKVSHQVELLGRSENIQDDELLLLLTAGQLIYSGLSESYENFENKSVEIAREILPEYGFEEAQINRICNLILASKMPSNPQNILESILIDAKMEFIGRSDYITQVKLLYLEQKNTLKDFSKDKFMKGQVEMLSGFEFYTTAARRLREIQAEDQINNLKSWK